MKKAEMAAAAIVISPSTVPQNQLCKREWMKEGEKTGNAPKKMERHPWMLPIWDIESSPDARSLSSVPS
jgi:hypothetical protein